MKSFKFPNGDMPAIGLGTWKMEDGSATSAVKTALLNGYRHIDCAPIYLNEADIGKAFEDVFSSGKVDRDDVWVTSKLWCNRHQPDLVAGALKQTLSDLKLEYLDLYMIHWPIVFRPEVHRPEKPDDFVSLEEMPLSETWQAMESCLEQGLCRNIGVCNFSIKKLKSILDNCRVGPSANQVECHPYLPQNDLFNFCKEQEIQLVGYSPLGSGDRPERMIEADDPNLFDDPVIREIAQACSASPGQVLLAWAVNRGAAAIPKSSNSQRQQENLAAADLVLNDDHRAAIDAIATHHRYVHGRFWEMPGGPYTVENLWDEED